MNQFKKWRLLILPFLLLIATLLALFNRKVESEPIQNTLHSTRETQTLQQEEFKHLLDKARSLSTTPTTEAQTVTFNAVGDIMLSRMVAKKIDITKDPLSPFKGMDELLKKSDFNFGNLESPFSSSDKYTSQNTLVFNTPQKNIEGLVAYNFKILNLANNHALDQNVSGLEITQKILQQNNLQFIGTGKTITQAWQPTYISVKGVKIAFIGASYASINDGGKSRNNYVARIEDVKELQNALSEAKKSADFVVVTMHAGTEYERNPNNAQTTFAHTAIDYGADLVIGAHPHWVQTIEKYKGVYIFYSLGNFIFDQAWSEETKQGLALAVTIKSKVPKAISNNAATLDDLQGTRIGAELERITLHPIIIENSHQPRPATEAETKKILNKINQTNTILYP